MHTSERLQEIYRLLFDHFGPQDWWPGDSPFEIMVGAILTQNTHWQNVEKAITNLKSADLLSLAALSAVPVEDLAGYIRPAGYYNIKAARLRNLFSMLNEHWDGDLSCFLQQPAAILSEHLLAVKGIGPETADAIILYAAKQPVFVVDNYTHRILARHEVIPEECGYFEIQEILTDNLEENTQYFNEYHALLVRVGKEFCKKTRPQCEECPLMACEGFDLC
ncbi:MAG: endonuclease III domain-containing protein [Desulfobulbus sp.]|nr:MAG: endonuclease III domain-containing protein [Desulfobulbus sp.]